MRRGKDEKERRTKEIKKMKTKQRKVEEKINTYWFWDR